MKKPSQELVDAFFQWYRNDPHSENEDFYTGTITLKSLSALSREQFIDFFFQFARDGGKVQGGDLVRHPYCDKPLRLNTRVSGTLLWSLSTRDSMNSRGLEESTSSRGSVRELPPFI